VFFFFETFSKKRNPEFLKLMHAITPFDHFASGSSGTPTFVAVGLSG